MLKRIYTNLFKPSEIGKYLKDKVGYVMLYILFLSLVVNIPLIVEISYTNTREENIRDTFTANIALAKLESQVVDYEYVGESVNPFFIGNSIYFGAKSNKIKYMGFTFMLEDSELVLYASTHKLKSYSYVDLNLDNIEFNLKDKADKEKMKDAFSSIYNDFKTMLIVGESFALVIGLAILAILIILLFVGFYSMQTPKLLVRYRFILISYASTIYFFNVLLENLFGFGFFSIIGIVMMMLNVRKAYINTIAMTLMVRKDLEPRENEEDVKDEGDGKGQV